MSWLREQNLLQLVCTLWNELPPDRRCELEPFLLRSAAAWALHAISIEHLSDDDWLTTDEVAHECGVTASTVRNWPKRYGLIKVKGRYRWGDVQALRRHRNQIQLQRRVS